MKLRELRKKANLTIYQLATNAGFDFTYIAKMEVGKVRPTENAVKAIAKALNADPIQLCYELGIMPTEHIKLVLESEQLKEIILAASERKWGAAIDGVLKMGVKNQ